MTNCYTEKCVYTKLFYKLKLIKIDLTKYLHIY